MKLTGTDIELNTLYNTDCLEFLKGMPDKSVDLILTDPPYGIGKHFDNDGLSKKEHINWCESWIKELCRIIKVGGAIYLTLGFQCVAEIKILFNMQENMRLKNWIIWYRQDGWKGNNGFAQSHEHILYYINDYYFVENLKEFSEIIKTARIKSGYKTISSLMDKMGLYKKIKRQNGTEDYYSGVGWFESGKKQPSLCEIIRLNQLLELPTKYRVNGNIDKKLFTVLFNKVDVCDDVWLSPKSEKNREGHPTQKPVALFERIIKASSNENDIIFDPFMGSGTTAVAAERLGRKWIGCEISPEYCAIAEKRINAERAQLKLNLKGENLC